MKILLNLFLAFILLCSCNNIEDKKDKAESNKNVKTTNKVILSSEIVWEKLNPARGNKSPQAGTIWGDRNGGVATGFLAKFVDGFSSPEHIHNVTYRAVVIKGLIHNDDANAENMWMPKGSFWTQPAGEKHITSAKGKENIAYVEIDHGPYLVKPVAEAFDNGERPVNVSVSNVVWLDSNKTHWVDSKSKAQISFLWQHAKTKNLQGLFIKLQKGFQGKLKSNGKIFHSIIIDGELNYEMTNSEELKVLDEGSYFTSEGEAVHTISNTDEVILYIRTDGMLKVEE